MTRAARYTLILLTTVSLAFSQGVSPTTPSKEYIRLGGSIIAIENAAPAVSLSPTTINFGGQTVGTTSAGQAVTLKNTGSVLLTINSLAITGENAGDFAETNTCSPTIQPSQSCSITTTFKPTTTGARTATLSITNNAAGSPQSVTLSGTGGALAPAVTLSTLSLSFANQNVGATSASQSVTLTNSGAAPLAISSVSLTGANPGDFAYTSTCGASLAAQAGCSLGVTFKPTAILGRSASLQITDNASGSPQSVSLAGTGLAPVAVVSPASLTFAHQNVTTTSAGQTVTLTNSGNLALSISSVSVGGTNAGDFTLVNNCGGSLSAGATCTVVVSFTPAAVGSRTASLSIADNAAASPQSVALTGTGAAPAVSLNPTSLSFGNQTVQSSAATPTTSILLTLTNTGNGELSIASAAISGTNAGDFSLGTGSNICGSALAAGGSCVYNVVFAPLATGSRSASLVITDNAGGSQTVSLTGSGVVPAILLSTTNLSFGAQKRGTTATQTLTVSNTGAGTLYMSSSASTPFGISGGTCTGVLAANSSCTLNVTFTPNSAGPIDGQLSIVDNAAGSPQSVILSGYGN